MRPFDIQGGFQRPSAVNGRVVSQDLDGGRAEAKLPAKSIQVALDAGIAVSIDNGDLLAGSGRGELIDPISMANSRRGVGSGYGWVEVDLQRRAAMAVARRSADVERVRDH